VLETPAPKAKWEVELESHMLRGQYGSKGNSRLGDGDRRVPDARQMAGDVGLNVGKPLCSTTLAIMPLCTATTLAMMSEPKSEDIHWTRLVPATTSTLSNQSATPMDSDHTCWAFDHISSTNLLDQRQPCQVVVALAS